MAETASLSPTTVRAIEQFLDEQMVEHDVPGLSIAILNDEGVLHAAGLGARNIDERSPATPDTLYSIASVTKTFTVLAVLQLVDRGDLGLEDEIREYVPFWNDVPGDPITVHDLLSHSSGMPTDYGGSREILFSDEAPTSPLVTREDDVRHANGATDRRITDTDRLMYSNRGFQILGELIEAVSGRTHADYVEAEIFDPLGMERSRVGYGKLSEEGDDVAMGYAIEDGEPVANDHDLEAVMRPPYSGGGILSSATELAKLGRCLLNDGALDGTRLLSSALVAKMRSHQARPLERVDGRRRGYGYGLLVEDCLGETLVGHTGTAPGVARAFVGLLPHSDVGVTLGVNTSGVPIDALGTGVLAILSDDRPEAAVPQLSLRAKLEAVAGTYEGYRGGLTATVEPAASEGYLTVTYEDGPGWEFPAFPESTARDDYSFYTVRANGIREPVTFRETDAGMELRCNVDVLRRTSPDC